MLKIFKHTKSYGAGLKLKHVNSMKDARKTNKQKEFRKGNFDT